jgi:hypothetical protein
MLLLAAQHVRQVVFTHRLGQRQASVLAARVVEVRLVKNTVPPSKQPNHTQHHKSLPSEMQAN